MGIEILVFRRGEGLDHKLGHEGNRNEEAALTGIFAEQIPVARIHTGGDRRLVILQLVDAGKSAADGIDISAKRKACDDDQSTGGEPQIIKESTKHTHAFDILLTRDCDPTKAICPRRITPWSYR